jgi:hypothetical protein
MSPFLQEDDSGWRAITKLTLQGPPVESPEAHKFALLLKIAERGEMLPCLKQKIS